MKAIDAEKAKPIKRTVEVVIDKRPDQAVELTVDVIVNGHHADEPIIVEIPAAVQKRKGREK